MYPSYKNEHTILYLQPAIYTKSRKGTHIHKEGTGKGVEQTTIFTFLTHSYRI